jgi:hypothetical protein
VNVLRFARPRAAFELMIDEDLGAYNWNCCIDSFVSIPDLDFH